MPAPLATQVLRERILALSWGSALLLQPRIARGILSPALPLWASPMTRMARLCTIGFLPASVRAAYGLPWSRHHARLFRGSLLAARCFLPCVPDRVRFVPPELLPWLTRQGVLTA